MPMSIHVHHGLMDGLHLGQFRLFSRNHESVVVAFVTLQETLIMLSKNIETALNKQVHIEAESSQIYLSMASWSETHGLEEFQNSCMLNRMKNVSICLR
jgi:hypothetical protein